MKIHLEAAEMLPTKQGYMRFILRKEIPFCVCCNKEAIFWASDYSSILLKEEETLGIWGPTCGEAQVSNFN